jgi:hypothetical protein
MVLLSPDPTSGVGQKRRFECASAVSAIAPIATESLCRNERHFGLGRDMQLGLDSHANTSYPLGLKRALGLDRFRGG